MSTNIIEIEHLTKVFYTDEIETHALSGVHLTIGRGEYVRRAAANRRCSRSSGCSIHRQGAVIR